MVLAEVNHAVRAALLNNQVDEVEVSRVARIELYDAALAPFQAATRWRIFWSCGLIADLRDSVATAEVINPMNLMTLWRGV